MVSNLRKDGLNSQQIADELSLSQDTISWLIADSSVNEKPQDVRIVGELSELDLKELLLLVQSWLMLLQKNVET